MQKRTLPRFILVVWLSLQVHKDTRIHAQAGDVHCSRITHKRQMLQVWKYFFYIFADVLWCIHTFLRPQDYIAFDGKTLLREPLKCGLLYTEYMYVMWKRFVCTLWIHLHYLRTRQTAQAVYKKTVAALCGFVSRCTVLYMHCMSCC